jgi:hypothetical protein
VYAAFYSYTDYEIGRVVDYLKQIDQFDNTVIAVILGDNGASKGGTQHGTVNPPINRLEGEKRIDAILQARDVIGTDESSTDYPIGWAAAANTPFRYWKADANTEGGTRNPMILHYPQGIKDKGGIRNQYGHVIDILPTTLEIVRGESPKVINGYKQEPFEGTSLAYSIDNAKAASKHTVQYYEIAGSRSIYKDGWKAGALHDAHEAFAIGEGADPSGRKVDFSKDVWELYNLNDDFNERINLASKNPEKLKELQAVFDQEARKYNVYPLKDFTAHDMPAGRTAYGKLKNITLFPGVDNLVGVSSPLYDGRSFTINAEAEIATGKEEGVLFAVGGEKSGISLFVKDGKFHYTHKTARDVFNLVSQTAIPTGKVDFKLVYEFSGPAEAGKAVGKETLFVNDLKVGERNFTAAQAAIQGGRNIDGTDVGRDQKNEVSDQYKAPFAFTGLLKKVTIKYE